MGESAEIVRRVHDRFNERDLDGFLSLCHEAIEFQDVPEMPDSGVYTGHEGVKRWFEKVQDVSDDLRLDIWETEERGRTVLVENSAEMHGSASGAAVSWRFWTVWRLLEGRVTYHHGYSSEADAREDFEQR